MMFGRSTRAGALVAIGVLTVAPAADDDPRDLGIVERAGTRLVQLDVSARGPEEVLEGLTADDFELRVGGRRIEDFVVDRVCREPLDVPQDPAEPPESGDGRSTVERAIAEAIAPVTYAFYLDQPLMTMAGRQQAIDGLRELIPRLFEGSRARAMLLYNGRDLETVVDMTSDPGELLEGLDRVEQERKNWDAYAASETVRLNDIVELLQSYGTEVAMGQARRYQNEEAWRVEKSLRRLSMVLGRFADYEQPKALLYYADILRRNPGEHYLAFFPNQRLMPTEQIGTQTIMEASASLTGISFDRLVDDASALGVRLYTVQAEGLMTDTMSFGRAPQGTLSDMSNVRVRDAQDALASVGAETGGESFLNGISAKKIARHLVDDLRCMVLISFDPGDLPQDEPLPVRLSTTRSNVKLQTRGRLVIQSEGEQQRSRLLAAFATAGSDEQSGGDAAIRGHVVPTDYRDGRWSALVQVSVPGSEVRTATWDIGASLISRSRVREDFSGRVRPTSPGALVVIEQETEFPPGPYEMVAVAHELSTDQLFSRRIEGDWPNPNKEPAVVSPIAVLQPEGGAFLRGGDVRTRGALVFGETEPIYTDRPTALIAVVCRAKSNRRTLTVERSLSGVNVVPFDAFTMPSEQRCTQIRDGVPTGAMGEGELVYRVRVLEDKVEVAARETSLAAVAPETADRADSNLDE